MSNKLAQIARESGERPAFIRWFGLTALAFILAAAQPTAWAAEAPTGPPIRLGMSTVLSGPTAELGLRMRSGVLAALHEANRAGGIQGRPLELIALDDGYEPTRTAPNMRELIEQRQVLAVVGNVGTPTAVAAIPIAMENRTPFYGAFTGAGVLRKTPPDRYVINYRASYAEETAAMVEALTGSVGLKPEEIAFFTQRDAYGDAGYTGGLAALKRHQLKSESAIAHVRYERNTLAVENALADLLLHQPAPKAVILVGAYAPSAAFIRQARQNDLKALFLNVSFVGPSALVKALGPDSEGVIVTQVVPPVDSDLPSVKDFRQAMQTQEPDSQSSYGALEGYLSTRLFCHALGTIQGELTREKVVQALEGLGTVDMGLGESVRLGPEEHQASHRVWPTIVRAGRLVPFRWEELAPAQAARTADARP